jgi:hypothetical protein
LTAPVFAVADDQATVLGRYVHDGSTGLACVERDGWRSVYCGAPMLPGWLLGRIAMAAGVHRYAPHGCAVHQRGPLVSVYAPLGGQVCVRAPAGQRLTPLEPSTDGQPWQPHPPAAEQLTLRFELGQTRFFLCSP